MSTQAITERSPSVIATPPPLELLDVSKVYGEAQLAVQALRGVTLTVHEGEFVAVMGPSGSGKSTLLQLAGGVESPSAGCVSICGRALVGQSSAARAQARLGAVGYVFGRNVWRPATTGGNRSWTDWRSQADPGRRADRCAGFGIGRGGPATPTRKG